MRPTDWLLLVYKVPRQPTAARVFVWRKLKQLGAVALQDAVWTLPANARTQEHFQWLAAEIEELGGEASLFVSQLLLGHDESLREQFESPVRQAYREILTALKRAKPDRAALSKQFQQLKAKDYWQMSLGEEVRRKLVTP